MNGLKIASRGLAPKCGGLALAMMTLLPLAAGCGRGGAPPAEGRLAIENIAKWRQLYLANHGRQPPADEAAFVGFIEKKMKQRGEPFNASMFLVSPRDGKKYVVRYGKESANLKENGVAVHEQEGCGGKVLVAFESARSTEVDAGELPALLSGKP